MPANDALNFVFNFLVAGVTASIAKTIVNPMERVKFVLQNQDSSIQVITGERQPYKGIIDCFVRIPKEQGFLSFWRGNGVNVMRYFPTQALNFSFNDFYNKRLTAVFEKNDKVALVKFVSGGLAGMCTASIIYPLDFCLTRIATDLGTDFTKGKNVVRREFFGFSDCIRKVSRAAGVRGLYGGFGMAVSSVSMYRALYFGLYDTFKRAANKYVYGGDKSVKPGLLLGLLLAQSATTISGICLYPLDTVSRRLMLESGRPKELRLFKGAIGAFKYLYRERGIGGFYRGVVANVLRSLSGALVLVFYDEVLHYTNWNDWRTSCR